MPLRFRIFRPFIMEGFYPLLFFVVAFLYASVGHGGASGYLAVMVLLGLSPVEMRPAGLVLNLAVATLATFHYARQGHFRVSLFVPLVLASIPMAWLGARQSFSDPVFKVVLALCLVAAILRLVIRFDEVIPGQERRLPIPVALLMGASIGWISGMIGIGGGILLSPLLLAGRWADVKTTAAVSAPFIVVNSLSGLLSLPAVTLPHGFTAWLIAAVAGGWLGAYAGAARFSSTVLRFMLSLVLSIAIAKLTGL